MVPSPEPHRDVPPINLNHELIEWALEDLLMNAFSALHKGHGPTMVMSFPT